MTREGREQASVDAVALTPARRLIERLREAHPAHVEALDEAQLQRLAGAMIAAGLSIGITEEEHLVRLAAIRLLLSDEQRRSSFLVALIARTLDNRAWSPARRLDFVYTHLMNRKPSPEAEELGVALLGAAGSGRSAAGAIVSPAEERGATFPHLGPDRLLDIRENRRAWEKALLILSLDFTGRLRDEIALDWPSFDDIVQALRDTIRPRLAAHGPPPPFAEDALERIASAAGAEALESVFRWRARVLRYVYLDPTAYDFWMVALTYCRHHPDAQPALGVPPERAREVVAQLAAHDLDAGFEERFGSAVEERLSEWDLLLQSRDVFLDQGEPYSVPQTFVRLAARIVRYQRFWRWVVETSNDAELSALHRGAEQLAAGHAELSFIDTLRAPRLLASPEADGPPPERRPLSPEEPR